MKWCLSLPFTDFAITTIDDLGEHVPKVLDYFGYTFTPSLSYIIGFVWYSV